MLIPTITQIELIFFLTKRYACVILIFMKTAYLDTFKVKFLTDDSPETIAHAVELIEIEIKTVEFLTSNGNHIDFDDGEF